MHSCSLLLRDVLRSPRFAALAVLVTGCSAVVTPASPLADAGSAQDTPLAVDVPATTDVALPRMDAGAVRTCSVASDCLSGEACIGPEGCGVPWTCQPAAGRACTDDLAPFCGCDGTTFRGSSSCPERPFAHRGPCAEPEVDAGLFCRLANGRPCPVGERCLESRCIACRCDPDGLLTCQDICQADAGAWRTCRSNADCPTGRCRVRAEGCGETGACTTDLERCDPTPTPYCGCDGRTFTSSLNCPDRIFAHRGPCIVVDGGAVPPGPECAPQRVFGMGFCPSRMDFFWDGLRCAPFNRCGCEGPDCGGLFPDLDACLAAHTRCPRVP